MGGRVTPDRFRRGRLRGTGMGYHGLGWRWQPIEVKEFASKRWTCHASASMCIVVYERRELTLEPRESWLRVRRTLVVAVLAKVSS
jgi:hypothetical protein